MNPQTSAHALILAIAPLFAIKWTGAVLAIVGARKSGYSSVARRSPAWVKKVTKNPRPPYQISDPAGRDNAAGMGSLGGPD